ncbi:MAG: site-specific integrase [Coprobacter sp.]|nr:site-specific integrase [Coprobacter sp.]
MTLVKTNLDSPSVNISVFEYIGRQAGQLEQLGKIRTGEIYRQTLNSFRKYRRQVDISFDRLDAHVIEQYESYMKSNGLSRNSTSFYMRVLRSLYNRAVEQGLAAPGIDPFKRVYTGVDKTAKRAITMNEIKRIKTLNLTDRPSLDYARDIFLFSFYMRGMSFIDIAYLRKKDLANGYISYIRKKTGQHLVIKWEKPMQDILEKYGENPTPYLLPVIVRQDRPERQQYLNRILFVNRKLKQVAALAGISIPLSMYVSRHSWASIARSKNIPISVISEGMGHDSEKTTRIYLNDIQSNTIDKANRQILKDL